MVREGKESEVFLMIVIGYQGIGKSTLAKNDIRCIDLESGNFWVRGKRYDEWYIPYCKIAVELSNQGYVVFVSSHDVVRECLSINRNGNTIQTYVCYPILGLKDSWIAKLKERYDKSGLDKNYKAWMNEENIIELANSGFMQLPIMSMNYDLKHIVLGSDSEYADHDTVCSGSMDALLPAT